MPEGPVKYPLYLCYGQKPGPQTKLLCLDTEKRTEALPEEPRRAHVTIAAPLC